MHEPGELTNTAGRYSVAVVHPGVFICLLGRFEILKHEHPGEAGTGHFKPVATAESTAKKVTRKASAKSVTRKSTGKVAAKPSARKRAS
jgi:hypothetical protein